jgi:hypothetical protein
MQRLSHVFLILACAVVGCARGDIVPGVCDSTFVSTMAELRRAEGSTTDSAALGAARQRILQQRGLTVEVMDRAARALANDPARATALFDAIEKRTVNAPPPAPPTAPARAPTTSTTRP